MECAYRKKFLSVNTARPLEEGHVQRQARWKKAKSEDLLATYRQDTTDFVTVRRPLKQHRARKKTAPRESNPGHLALAASALATELRRPADNHSLSSPQRPCLKELLLTTELIAA